MTGLNDVRVLRNFLGDEVHEDDHEIPKYNPKKLNMGRLGNIRIRNGTIELDRTSKNDEVRIPAQTDYIAGPKGTYAAEEMDQPGGTRGMGRAVLMGNVKPAYVAPKVTYSAKYPGGTEGMGRNVLMGNVKPAYIAPQKKTYSETQKEKMEKMAKSKSTPPKYIKAKPAKEEPIANMYFPHAFTKPAATGQYITPQYSETEENYSGMTPAEIRERKTWNRRQKELESSQRELTQRQKQVDYATNRKWQLAKQKQNIEDTRVALGKLKYEQSGFGKFVNAIHDPGLSRWGGRVQENIGQNMGGSIVGSFEDKGATAGLQRAILAKQAWLAFTIKKYNNKNMNMNEALLAGGAGTVGEQKRYAELSRAIERAQNAAAATGFMGGASGRTMVRSNARPQNLRPFTQLGYDAGGSYGSFSPEAFSRLGVSQGLQAVRPENKWDALIGRGSGGSGGQNINKITEIIGKAPNPLGNVESAAAKVKRFL